MTEIWQILSMLWVELLQQFIYSLQSSLFLRRMNTLHLQMEVALLSVANTLLQIKCSNSLHLPRQVQAVLAINYYSLASQILVAKSFSLFCSQNAPLLIDSWVLFTVCRQCIILISTSQCIVLALSLNLWCNRYYNALFHDRYIILQIC